VLSGFLITGVLLDSRSQPHYFKRFYGRRVLRILPLYYLLLIVLLALPQDRTFVLLSFLHLSNVAPLLGVPMTFPVLWSLSVEEHFYLFWPHVVRRAEGPALAGVALSICAVEPLLRAWGFARGMDTHFLTWFRIDGLAWGALLAVFMRSPTRTPVQTRAISYALPVLGVLLMFLGGPHGIMTRTTQFGAALQYLPWDWMFAGLVATAAGAPTHPIQRLLRWEPLRRSGDLSYCLYLVHLLVFAGYDHVAQAYQLDARGIVGNLPAMVLRFGIVTAICFGLASLSFSYVEAPALRLRRYIR
jgi:peptidoglycan/LPS O-acetylase OafA/YrhL